MTKRVAVADRKSRTGSASKRGSLRPRAFRRRIAAWVWANRANRGLTQQQLAHALGLHRPAIAEIEAGRRSLRAEEALTLIITFGFSPQEIPHG